MARRSLASLSGGVAEIDPTKQMERSVEKLDQKLGFSERKSLAHEVEMIERSIAQNLNGEKDDPKVLKQLYHKKMLLAKDDEITFSGDGKDLAYKEIKEIEGRIIPKMPTKNEMWPKNDISDKAKAVRHNLEFQKDYDSDIRRWQELKRRLEPDNPNAQNLDNIRPD
jgi:hypothetical protein